MGVIKEAFINNYFKMMFNEWGTFGLNEIKCDGNYSPLLMIMDIG